MLQNIKEFYGKKLAAADGDIGHVKDFYFDDKSWVIRYLVADTGSWLSGRLVLLSPNAFGKLDAPEKALHVNLLKQQIQDSPPIESHKPVSRQYEIDYYNYYGWPAYWETGSITGYPVIMSPSLAALEQRAKNQAPADRHLQSTRDITGYKIQTSKGESGRVNSFLIDVRTWVIRELVVDVGHWPSGKELLISVSRIDRISYEDSKVLLRSDADSSAEMAWQEPSDKKSE